MHHTLGLAWGLNNKERMGWAKHLFLSFFPWLQIQCDQLLQLPAAFTSPLWWSVPCSGSQNEYFFRLFAFINFFWVIASEKEKRHSTFTSSLTPLLSLLSLCVRMAVIIVLYITEPLWRLNNECMSITLNLHVTLKKNAHSMYPDIHL